MKKLLSASMIICTVLVLLSCASAPPPPAPAPELAAEQPVPPPPSPPPEPVPAPQANFTEVYEQFSGDIILEGAKTYTVKWKDYLAKITINNYGKANGHYFPLIMLASRNVVTDPDLIVAGTKLTIPDLQRNLNDPGARAKIKEFLNEIANVYDRKGQRRVRDDLRALANTL